MDQRFRLLVALACVTLCASAADESTESSHAATIRDPAGAGDLVHFTHSMALVVGCGAYAHLPSLPGVAADLAAVRTALAAQGFAVSVLTDPTATILGQALRDWFHRWGDQPDARLVLYIASRGLMSGTAYLAGVDTPESIDDPAFSSHAVALADLVTLMNQAHARHILCLLDSCLALTELANASPPVSVTVPLAVNPVRFLLTSGSAHEMPPAISQFRLALVAGLAGAADLNHDGLILGSELFTYLRQQAIASEDRPGGHPQTPQARVWSSGPGAAGDPILMGAALPPGRSPLLVSGPPPAAAAPAAATTAATAAPAVAPPAMDDAQRARCYDAAEALEPAGSDSERWLAWTAVTRAAPATASSWSARDQSMQARARVVLDSLRPRLSAAERARALSLSAALDASSYASQADRQAGWAIVQRLWDVNDEDLGPDELPHMHLIEAKLAALGLPLTTRVSTPAWASAHGKDAIGRWADVVVGSVPLRMRWIAAGAFDMGSPISEAHRQDNEVQHRVTLTQGFWCAETLCTQAFWQALAGTTPSHFSGDPQRPVEQVSWNDVQDAITTLNARVPGGGFALPTEAQWEYACRAGTSGPYAGPSLIALGWYKANSDAQTHPVKGKAANAWGLYDMHGNVWEWCADAYGDYVPAPVTDPQGPGSSMVRIFRGGSWHYEAWGCRSAMRSWKEPGYRSDMLGFRVCAHPIAGSGLVPLPVPAAAP